MVAAPGGTLSYEQLALTEGLLRLQRNTTNLQMSKGHKIMMASCDCIVLPVYTRWSGSIKSKLLGSYFHNLIKLQLFH